MPDRPARRVFTFQEARGLLPAVRERTRRALEEIQALETAGDEEANPEAKRTELEEAANRILHEWSADVQAFGIEVKGPWLVDFDSGGGYYCWCWPEDSLEFFHGYEEGFSGRLRLQ